MTESTHPEYWRHRKGRHFEQMALNHLLKQELILVTRNFRCRLGEIDLVMNSQQFLVFVEVRYRRKDHHGSACATVDPRKQSKLRNAARYFLLLHPQFANQPCRFDVVGLQEHDKLQPAIEWIQNAFY